MEQKLLNLKINFISWNLIKFSFKNDFLTGTLKIKPSISNGKELGWVNLQEI
jgi:hypothetical protein